jgi:ABC-type multidrug transport system ATPase subunit
MPLVLRARALWKSYAAGVIGCSARVWVLRGADLELHEGECVALLGARGAGTTTLLHCLAGLRRPDAGTIEQTLEARLVTPAGTCPDDAPCERDRLLLYDESGGGVDRVEPWVMQRSRRGAGAALIATHELARVRHVADRILLLRDGRLTELDRAAGIRRVAERRVERTR